VPVAHAPNPTHHRTNIPSTLPQSILCVSAPDPEAPGFGTALRRFSSLFFILKKCIIMHFPPKSAPNMHYNALFAQIDPTPSGHPSLQSSVNHLAIPVLPIHFLHTKLNSSIGSGAFCAVRSGGNCDSSSFYWSAFLDRHRRSFASRSSNLSRGAKSGSSANSNSSSAFARRSSAEIS